MKLKDLIEKLQEIEKSGCGNYDIDIEVSEGWLEIERVFFGHDSKFVTIRAKL